MMIDNDIFESYLHCKYKAYLKLGGNHGNRSEYEIMKSEIKSLYKRDALQRVIPSCEKKEILNNQDLSSAIKDGNKVIVDAHVSYGDLQSYCDFTERTPGKSDLGAFHYLPVLFVEKEKLSKEDKLMMAYNGLVIGNMQNRQPEYGKIIYGKRFAISKIKFDEKLDIVTKIINDLRKYHDNGSLPQLILNRHCEICEFNATCREKAIKDGNLSLLGQIGAKEVLKKNKKGIFNLTQLSYTFRPRRKRKRPDGFRRPHSVALRALAIRENKTYVHGTPELSRKATEIYFDVEGVEEGNFIYLVGLIVISNGQIEKHSFWANTPDEEMDAFLQFLRIIRNHDSYVLYHHGSYELSYLKRMKRKAAVVAHDIDAIIANCCNLLAVFYANVYLPTYTNGLKDIGTFLGFRWTDKNASGIQSIVWRKKWEMHELGEYKERLIQYNMEDCLVLLRVKNFIDYIATKESSNKDGKSSEIIFVENLKKASPFKFLAGEFALPEFDALNKYAHFDYQRERVHVRTNTYLRQYYAKAVDVKRGHKYNYIGVPNKSVPSPKKEICPLCNKISKKTFKTLSKKVIDLKFSKSGVKRWITQINSHLYYCYKCKKLFIPQWYKNIERKYGHDLMAWTMYQHVVKWQSFRQITTDLQELFELHVEKSNTHIFKSYIMDYYQETFENISRKILNSSVLYVDETPINMKVESGYAWVLTNTEEVISFYRSTREGDFIKEYLANFKGILVSDFYSVYDTLNCLQQKCLIHLIRDFNDDLLKNPFDEEFKGMAKSLTFLLQEIVATIDERGLKKRYLNKHNKSVNKFFNDISTKEYKSDTAAQYQKRILKNQSKLFLFLNHDNVSWNNNAVEHAIKLLATHKNKNLNFFRESRMEEYLKIMSIYQTCRCKGVSFLKFLLSKEKDIDNYCGNFLRKRKITAMF
jgi:predicted RecB family nuclease